MEQITAGKERTLIEVRWAKLLRVLTVPPVMAFILTTLMYIAIGSELFAAPIRYAEAVFTLTLLPIIPYGLCAAIPSMKRGGRKLERSLGIVFSLVGYLMGTLFAIFCGGTKLEMTLYITYIISGALLGIFTFLFRFKASGHTCGAAGPAAMLVYRLGPWWLFAFLLLVPIFISSLKLKRHTLAELFAGAAVSVGALLIAIRIVSLF